jgi:hypothetical protein
LEPGGEWMGEKIPFCAFPVRVQGIVNYELKIGGHRGRGRRLSMRHEGKDVEDDGGYLGDTVVVRQRRVASCQWSVRESSPENCQSIVDDRRS